MKVMVLPGDGIGPDIVKSSLAVIDRLNENYGCNLEPEINNINAEAFATGKSTLDELIEDVSKYKVMLKGPMGVPETRNKEGTEAGLDIVLGLRFRLDMYANVRPVKLLPGISSVLRGFGDGKTIDYTIIRENSEGLYSSHFGGLVLRDEVGVDTQTITRKGTERISRFAFELSRKSKGNPYGEKSVTCVDKSNVLKTFSFFRKVFTEVAGNYSDIKPMYMYADAMTQYMLQKPDTLNVVVAENMFADLLSDLGAATVGGLGITPSGNFSDRIAMFEPVHGSAPDIAGKGIANPTAILLSTAMMLDWLGMSEASGALEKAVYDNIANGRTTSDLGGKLNTEQYTQEVLNKI